SPLSFYWIFTGNSATFNISGTIISYNSTQSVEVYFTPLADRIKMVGLPNTEIHLADGSLYLIPNIPNYIIIALVTLDPICSIYIVANQSIVNDYWNITESVIVESNLIINTSSIS